MKANKELNDYFLNSDIQLYSASCKAKIHFNYIRPFILRNCQKCLLFDELPEDLR